MLPEFRPLWTLTVSGHRPLSLADSLSPSLSPPQVHTRVTCRRGRLRLLSHHLVYCVTTFLFASVPGGKSYLLSPRKSCRWNGKIRFLAKCLQKDRPQPGEKPDAALVGRCLLPGPLPHPHSGCSYRSVTVPLGWVHSFPLQLHVASTHRTSASKDYYFSSSYSNYFLFPLPFCLPQTMQDLRLPNWHSVFPYMSILPQALKMAD